MSKYLITTIDNPFDPFDDFDNWYRFDMDKGYSTCSYLARIAHTSDQLSEKENDRQMELAIDEIIKFDFQNIYVKVRKEQSEKNEPYQTSKQTKKD